MDALTRRGLVNAVVRPPGGVRVEIRATETEIDLCGSPAELRGIGHSLEAMAGGQVREFTANTTADPVPYHRMLSGLRVVASAGQIRVAISGAWLVVEGEADRQAAFASWLAAGFVLLTVIFSPSGPLTP